MKVSVGGKVFFYDVCSPSSFHHMVYIHDHQTVNKNIQISFEYLYRPDALFCTPREPSHKHSIELQKLFPSKMPLFCHWQVFSTAEKCYLKLLRSRNVVWTWERLVVQHVLVKNKIARNNLFTSRSENTLKAEFPFSWIGCHIKFKKLSQTYYWPVAGGRIAEFITFPRVFEQCEM